MKPWNKAQRDKLAQLAATAATGAELVRAFASAGHERTAQALYSQMRELGLGDRYPSLLTSLYHHIHSKTSAPAPAARIATKPHTTTNMARVRHIVQSVEYGDMTRSQAFNAIKRLMRS